MCRNGDTHFSSGPSTMQMPHCLMAAGDVSCEAAGKIMMPSSAASFRSVGLWWDAWPSRRSSSGRMEGVGTQLYMYIYESVTVNLAHLDCAIATALRQQKEQPGAGQCSSAALYGHKMLQPRCAFRCARYPSCALHSLQPLPRHGHFGYVIEPHGPDAICRPLGRGTPASAGTPSP